MTTAALDPDPRIERTRRLVLAATMDLLGEVGYGPLTIEAVAGRSGVAKSTIYRHWPGKLALVEDAFALLKAPSPVPPPGPVQERVTAILTELAQHCCSSTFSSCLPALIDAAERYPDVRDLHRRISDERSAPMRAVLAEAVEAGELPTTTDPLLLSQALAGPIFLHRLLLHEPFPPDRVSDLVHQLLC